MSGGIRLAKKKASDMGDALPFPPYMIIKILNVAHVRDVDGMRSGE